MTYVELAYACATTVGLGALFLKEPPKGDHKRYVVGLSVLACAYLTWTGRAAELLVFAIAQAVAKRGKRTDLFVLSAVLPPLLLISMQPLASGEAWVLPIGAVALALRPRLDAVSQESAPASAEHPTT